MNKQTILKYFIECILIFVSIIGAFLFDSEREKRQLKEQELGILKDVMTDLIKDSIQYTMRIEQATNLRADLNKLITILEAKNKIEVDDISVLFKPIEIVLNKTTYDVIKSTGGFRYITDKELVNGLSDYYNTRAYIAEIYSTIISTVDKEIAWHLTRETKFIDNVKPSNSYLLFTHTIDDSSLRKIVGDQYLINLCYTRRSLLDQLKSVFENFQMKRSRELQIKCQTYLNVRT